jgi:hypothetical protein
MELRGALEFIDDYKRVHAAANKAELQKAYIERFRPRQERSVFVGKGYALRFSEARTVGFSNTVLSLSALQMHDARPFVVVVARSSGIDFLLSNSTFLKKISHSSHELRVGNIKGSFNGTDIMLEYEGTPNKPENFDLLFAQHSAFTWTENVERLVEATTAIVGRDNRFRPTIAQIGVVLAAPDRAAAALELPKFRAVEEELKGLVSQRRAEILEAARLDNVNLRGNAIEQILTGGINAHELGDFRRNLGDVRLVVDIKTKLLDRASAPKAYNVDKMLTFLSETGSVFCFLMVGVDTKAGTVGARLLPIFDNSLMDVTCVQHHWAGRTSRGVTQLSGHLGHALAADYVPVIDITRARRFLESLLAL